MSNMNIVHSIIQKAGEVDPVLRDSLIELAREIERIGLIIDPAPIVPRKYDLGIDNSPLPVIVFSYVLSTTNLRLLWEAPQVGFLIYEIRKGTDWDTANRVVVTTNLSVVLDPIEIGTTTYLIKSQNDDGIYSLEATSLDVVVPEIGSVSITSETIDSNVLLYWTLPLTTFNIQYFIILRNGVEYTRLNATFIHIKELAGGNFDYSVTPVDIAGNIGPEVIININVSDPPDFTLRDKFISDFTLGTHTNTYRQPENNHLLALVNLTETWENHFITRAWTSPQDQVNAGYPLFIQPVPTTGTYKEIFDIGIIITGALITTSWTYEMITETFNIGVSTRVSDDGAIWSSAQIGQNVYFPSARYIETTIDFTGANDKALMDFYNFEIAVSVKEEMDSGEINAINSDVNGTIVTLNKAYKDINSITVSTKTTTEQFTAVYRFNDIPNPTTFAVFVYDTSGIRVSKTVQWKTRGII